MADKKAWQPDPAAGYGKHEYRQIDPSTVNPEHYARELRGEESYYGDVREYNTADNSKHPDTTADLYDCGLIGSKIEIHAGETPTWVGKWIMTNIPTVKAPYVYLRAARWCEGNYASLAEEVQAFQSAQELVPAHEVGLVVGDDNLYKQVKVTLIKRGLIDREQRQMVATGVNTRARLKEQAQHTAPVKVG